MGLFGQAHFIFPFCKLCGAKSRMRSNIAIVPAADVTQRAHFCRANTSKLM